VSAGYLRLSFGPDTNHEDIDGFLAEFSKLAERQRAAA